MIDQTELINRVRVVTHLRNNMAKEPAPAPEARLEDLVYALLADADSCRRREDLLALRLQDFPEETWQRIKTADAARFDKVPAASQLGSVLATVVTPAAPEPLDPERLLDHAGALLIQEQEAADDLARERTRRLLRVFHKGFALGCHYNSSSLTEPSDFATGRREDAFIGEVEAYLEANEQLLGEAAEWNPCQPWGWIDPTIRKRGTCVAEMLVILTLGAYWPFGRNPNWMMVKEVAWTIHPARFPRVLPALYRALEPLQKDGIIEISQYPVSERGPFAPHTGVRATPAWLEQAGPLM